MLISYFTEKENNSGPFGGFFDTEFRTEEMIKWHQGAENQSPQQ